MDSEVTVTYHYPLGAEVTYANLTCPESTNASQLRDLIWAALDEDERPLKPAKIILKQKGHPEPLAPETVLGTLMTSGGVSVDVLFPSSSPITAPGPGRKRKRAEEEVDQPKKTYFDKPTVELQGITLRWKQHIEREKLVNRCWDKFRSEKVVLLSSPASSGKTVLMTLFATKYEDKVAILELDFTNPRPPAELFLEKGIDVNKPSECQIEGETIVLVDDVQAKYSDEAFWTFFQKSVLMRLRKNVRFLLSATNTLQAGPNPSPAHFSEFSRLQTDDFKLTDSECERVLDLAAEAVGLGDVFKDYSKFRRCVLLESQGLVGAIRVAVKATYNHFYHCGPFSEEDAFGFYFSDKYDEYLGRCFSGGFKQLPQNAPLLQGLRKCLVHIKLATRAFLSSLGESQDVYYQLMAAGVITEKDGCVEFTSHLARRYICYLLYPSRSTSLSPVSFGKTII